MILAVGERADLSFLPGGNEDGKRPDRHRSLGKDEPSGILCRGGCGYGRRGTFPRPSLREKEVPRPSTNTCKGSSGKPAEDTREVVRLDKINLDYFSPVERVKSLALLR